MEITFNWDSNEVNALLTELEAKGMYDLAEKIETSFHHNLAKSRKSDAKKQFRANGWSDGLVFNHSNGDITCLYWSYKNKTYSTVPMYLNGILMGQPASLSLINDTYTTIAVDSGFKRDNRDNL